MLSLAIEGFFDWDLQTDRVYLNKTYCGLMGCEAYNLRKDAIPVIDLCENHQAFFASVKKHLDGKSSVSSFSQFVRFPKKAPRWLKCRCRTAEFDLHGSPSRIIGSIIDISSRKKDREARQKLNRALLAINNCNQVLLHAKKEAELLEGICRAIVAEGGYRMVWVGYAQHDQAKSVRPVAQAGFEEGYLETLGITWTDTERGQGPSGRAIRSGKPETTRNMLLDPRFKPWREEALKRGYASSLSLPLIADNAVFGTITMYSSLPDAFNTEEIKLLSSLAENLSYGITMLRALDARERAEEELRQSEQRYRNLFQNEHTVMMIFDPKDGKVIDANPAAVKFYGWSRDELLGMNVMQINTLSEPEIKAEMHKARAMEKNYFNFRHRLADGSIRDVEVVSGPISIEGRSLLYSIIHDITDRKRYQDALLENRERIQVIMGSVNAGTWSTNVVTYESEWSEELWHIYGLQPHSCKPSLENWQNTIIPEDREMVQRTVFETINNAAEYNCTWRVQDADGNIRWLMGKGNPVRDSDGKVIKYVGITLDITEQKRAEAEKSKLESRIRKSERLDTIGTLAGGIAHDFNNILTPILGYAEMGKMKVPEDNPLHEYFSEIRQAAERAQNLVSQILTFGKAEESEPSIVSIKSIVEEALKLLRPSIPSTIAIEKHIDPLCRNILADPSKIHQVIVNLCTNAYQAMETSGGTLTIKLEEIALDGSSMKMLPELQEKRYAKLTISDTGCGMDQMTMERIFEPFFTTKPVNKGTGLGLPVVHGIISGYRGTITAESQPGKGSSFHIYLPVIETKITDPKKVKKITGGNENILIIDDEQATLKMMTLMLTKFGYRIRTLNSPLQALELFRESPGQFDLVITDLTMPEMTGLALASALQKIRPGLPLILMTGYGKDIESARDLEKYGISRLLKKPVRLENLVSTINEMFPDKVDT